jgi:pimeloyl-ACP methyl ester carboxylesterase
MITFVLVHGAWHGAWCWELLTPILEDRGHRVITVELPATDPTAGSAAYAELALDHMIGVPDSEAVVVGHSLGGLTIPLIAEARGVRRLVFLCALIARPGTSLREQLGEQPDMFSPGFDGAPARDELGRSLWPDREEAIRTFYPDCPRELAERAAARLQPQASLPNAERSPLRRWPSVPCTYILARDDGVINPHWSRRAARERLDTEALELPGGHSPIVARPLELAELLITSAA